MSTRDLLGREINRFRIVEPVLSCENRVDQKPLTLEDELYHATPRPSLTAVIRNLEACLAEKEPGSYAHNHLSGIIELHKETLKQQNCI